MDMDNIPNNEIRILNPEKKPLGELWIEVLEKGLLEKVPALDKRWAKKLSLSEYEPLVCAGGKVKTGVDLEEWIYKARSFREDIHYLLELNHHEFWSSMVFEKAILRALISFLQNSTPSYLNLQILVKDDDVLRLYQTILSDVVRVICRIITNKESDEEWIEKSHLKELIYSNYLVSIPMVFDLILACGESNIKLVKKIIETLFTIEPKYEEDLRSALMYFPTVFKRIQIEAESEGVATIDAKVRISQVTFSENLDTPYDDLALFTLDCAYSLRLLFEISNQAVEFCNQLSLDQRISNFYDNTIPYLYKHICDITQDAKSLSWLNQARLQFLRAFRAMAYVHIENVLNNPEANQRSSENFIAMMTQNLSQRMFVIDYQRMYPIEVDIDIFKQACGELDSFKAGYIQRAYKEESDAALAEMIGALDFEDEVEGTWPDYKEASPIEANDFQHITPSSVSTNGRCLEKEVESILDMFPDLGSGFVRKLLSRYDNHEETVAAILEGNIPPDLINADKSEIYIPPDTTEQAYNEIKSTRLNIFDGDQYDVMTNDRPNCIIKRGKGFPGAPKNLTELLDDKSHVKEMRERFKAYDLVEEIVVSRSNEYDDEYDDSYEALLEGEVNTRKPNELKKFAADIMDDESESEEEEVENDMSKSTTCANGLNFCENPEVIRARYEANRNAKCSTRNKPSSGPKPVDVIGNAKGQGQDKQTIINRNKKEANKSSRANHNRKSGASWKRSRGMIPS